MSIRTNIVTTTCVLLMMACAAQGAPIPLDTALDLTQAFPDINSSSSLVTTYVAATKSFIVTSYPIQYTEADGTTTHNIGGASQFTLTASIDNSGALQSGGTLTISGLISGVVDPFDNLITVNLTDFGVSGTGSSAKFEFIGTTTGGAMATEFSPKVGVILVPGDGSYTGWFGSDFAGGSGATVDTFLIPEPASVMLLLGCMSAVASRRRRRRSL